MFSTEIKVNGVYISGTIKQGNDHGKTRYALFSEMNLKDKSESGFWTSEKLKMLVSELECVIDKLDKEN